MLCFFFFFGGGGGPELRIRYVDVCSNCLGLQGSAGFRDKGLLTGKSFKVLGSIEFGLGVVERR